MKKLYETQEVPKRAFLVGIRDDTPGETASLAREIVGLVHTLGLEIVAQEQVHIRERHPQFSMGTGKAAELAEKAAAMKADCFVFDGELSPSQQRNWETLSGITAIDRQELIIQIFADRARTREAELQVELAALSYSLPRLQHKYLDLARQRGGRYGAKGQGETKLETDRRLVEKHIDRLKQELAEVRKNREVQRKKRERRGIPTCALVGYTNAGKSSLLNAMTKADTLVEDKLFATLDPATRQLDRGSGRPLLLIDTVGFIRHLPHTLVEAFRSTLEEVSRCDLLIQVLDSADPDLDRYFETTLSVLRELGAGAIPMILALNKIDQVDSWETLQALQERYAQRCSASVLVSAKNHRGIDELIRCMEGLLVEEITRFRFPPDRHDLVRLLHRNGTVFSEVYGDGSIDLEAQVDPQIQERLKVYEVMEKTVEAPQPAP
ncbi:MAG: GTPase HflX [Treponema sp.]|jgi:GTP-binding protein HflX|nr:GTPase HflX [Treponema sp.]